MSTAYRNSGAFGPYAPVGRYPSSFSDRRAKDWSQISGELS